MTGNLGAFVAVFRNNRPSRKPQLWEDLPLAVRRRVLIEVAGRARPGWFDRGHVVDLSAVGSSGASPLRMELFPRDPMDRALFLYGVFEISETRLVQAFLRPGMTFLDVGANSGYYSLIAAARVGDAGTVHGFEPNRVIRDRFVRNIALNGLESRVKVHSEAISQETGEIRFYASIVDNSGVSSTLPGKDRSASPTIVPCVALDDFAGKLGRAVHLIKIDVEGAEGSVFEGGRELLGSSDGPSLIFEAFQVGPHLGTLEALGYTVRRIHYTLSDGLDFRGPEERFDDIFGAYEAPNYFAVKDAAILDALRARANAKRPVTLRFLGGI